MLKISVSGGYRAGRCELASARLLRDGPHRGAPGLLRGAERAEMGSLVPAKSDSFPLKRIDAKASVFEDNPVVHSFSDVDTVFYLSIYLSLPHASPQKQP